MTTKKEAKTQTGKRKPYKRAECPYCHKVKGNLPNHILQKHPTEAAARAANTPAIDRAVLTGEKPPGAVEMTLHPEDIVYYCTGCRAELRKGEESCWNCGQALDWTNIE